MSGWSLDLRGIYLFREGLESLMITHCDDHARLV